MSFLSAHPPARLPACLPACLPVRLAFCRLPAACYVTVCLKSGCSFASHIGCLPLVGIHAALAASLPDEQLFVVTLRSVVTAAKRLLGGHFWLAVGMATLPSTPWVVSSNGRVANIVLETAAGL